MKSVSLSIAKTNLGQLIDEVLNGQPVVVGRGKRRVILKPFDPTDQQAEQAEFQAAFTSAPPEPRDAVNRIRRVIRRVRRTG
ncbi:MAG: type II toxin-antitoxin system Phd/YefM family antitoxin [Verrucomicrobiales bacterium]|nr:type II toxin-antitoxin system Phd/YefM family antitoxin [Verrucomicrobiales bacterium]